MLLNPYIYESSSDTPDLSGKDITRVYGLWKTNLATIDYAIQVHDTAGTPNVRYVFFDNNDKISLDSKVSTNTTPTTDSLQDFIDDDMSGTVLYIRTLYCQVTGHALTSPSFLTLTAKIYDTTNGLVEKNGTCGIEFLEASYIEGSAITEMDSGNDFTTYSVASIDSSQSGDIGIVMINVNSGSSRYFVSLDKGTTKFISNYRNTAGTNFLTTYISQQTTEDQRRIAVTVDRTTDETKAYYNTTLQQTVTSLTGTFTNNTFRLGASLDGTSFKWKGIFQMFIVCDESHSSSTVTDVDTELDKFYNF